MNEPPLRRALRKSTQKARASVVSRLRADLSIQRKVHACHDYVMHKLR